MINLKQLKYLVVVPSLTAVGHADIASVQLVLATGLIESQYQYLAQVNGPALGFWQMEEETAEDIWDNWLMYRADLLPGVYDLMADHKDRYQQLTWNLKYAAVMCRFKYLRSAHPLPHPNDIQAMSTFWKEAYNTNLGAGDPQKFVDLAAQYDIINL